MGLPKKNEMIAKITRKITILKFPPTGPLSIPTHSEHSPNRGLAGAGKLAPSKDIHLVVCAAPSHATGVATGNATGAKSATAPPCMVSGTVSGAVCLWRGRNCCKVAADAHAGAVEVLSAGSARGGVVVSGGRDAKVSGLPTAVRGGGVLVCM